MGINAQTKYNFLYDSFSTDTGNVKGQYRGTSLISQLRLLGFFPRNQRVMGQWVAGLIWPALLRLFVNLLQTFFLYKKWSTARYLGSIPRKILIQKPAAKRHTDLYFQLLA